MSGLPDCHGKPPTREYHPNVYLDPDKHEESCRNCGCVLQTVEFVNENFESLPTTGPTTFNKYNRPPKENYKILRECCDTLDISKADKTTAKSILTKLNQKLESWPGGTTGKLRALACIYFATDKKPISLTIMAEKCGVDSGTLLRSVWQCGGELKGQGGGNTVAKIPTKVKSPSIFIEKGLSALKDLTGEQKIQIEKRCKFLVDYARENNFIEGRNPVCIAAAVILFGLQTFPGYKFSAASKKSICGELSVTQSTTNERYREIVNSLVEKASLYTPREVTKKNIAEIYNSVEHYLKDELKDTESVPPSFASSTKQRKERQELLEQVKKKLEQSRGNPEEAGSFSWTTEELKIERLLLANVPEEDILSGYVDQDNRCLLFVNHDLESEELTEQDMKQSEVDTYITGKRKRKNQKRPAKRYKPISD